MFHNTGRFRYRLYHNTNAEYNGFFYAAEAMKEAEQVLYEGYEENYQILLIFRSVDEAIISKSTP